MSYIGQTLPTDVFGGYATDTFAGDGSATTFTLSQAPFNEQGLIVVINNVIQQPTTNYTVSGTTLTIVGTAVASGDVIYARHTGVALPIGEANALDLQGQSDKLILDADADTTISADTDDQIDIKIGGSDIFQMTASKLDLNGKELVLDADADTSITADTDDQIDFKVGGVDEMTLSSTGLVINEGSNDRDFRVESNNRSSMLHVNGGTDTVLIGTDTTSDEFFNADGSYVPGFQTFGTSNTAGRVSSFNYGSADSGGPMVILSKNRNTTSASHTVVQADDQLGNISFQGSDGTTYIEGAGIRSYVQSGVGGDDVPAYLAFFTNTGSTGTTERMRITSAGDVLVGTGDGDATIDSSNFGIALRYYGEVRMARDAGASSPVLDAYGTAGQFRVMGDGDVENTNSRIGSISDERIKTNITDANSQWNDIKAIEVKNFERKDDVAKYGAGKKVQIGVIAQQVESVSPGLVKDRDPTKVEINMSSEFGTLYTADDAETKDGNDAVLYTSDDDEVKNGTAKVGDIKTEATHSKKVGDIKETKDQVKSVGYSVLYMKAIKALQEAMAKIETLETKVKALEDA